jgi:hypothetical protein
MKTLEHTPTAFLQLKSQKRNRRNSLLFILLLFAIIVPGCKKFVAVNPPSTSILGSGAYSTDNTAISVLNGLYSKEEITITSEGSFPSLSFFAGLSSDEYNLISTVTNASQIAYYTNNLSTGVSSAYWSSFYTRIYTCNAAIEGLTASTSLTPGVKQQLIGEAKFMRALYYFYLTNLYGDVPLQLNTDYVVNSTLARAPQTVVYHQIVSDLTEAEGLLYDGYLQSNLILPYAAASAERVRPNKYAAAALLARIYLYTTDYTNAAAQASIVINNSTYYSLVNLNTVFLKNSKEAIWQLQPVNGTFNTPDAQFFIYPTTGGPTTQNPVYLSNSLSNSFEPGDQRRVNGNWVNSMTVGTTTYIYPFKYKVYLSNSGVTTASALTEYQMVLRLGEQYLIRSEAEAQLSQLPQATADLNMIRTRAGLAGTTAVTQAQLLTSILHERQVELFSELGQRWFDLKRTGNIDAVMNVQTPLKGGAWNSYKQLYPVNNADIQKDANLTQNQGY